jgi:hypothetical protein
MMQHPKRKADGDDDEIETGPVKHWNLRTIAQRQEFLLQAKVSDCYTAGSSCQDSTSDIHDLRARERHKGVQMLVILDL